MLVTLDLLLVLIQRLHGFRRTVADDDDNEVGASKLQVMVGLSTGVE